MNEPEPHQQDPMGPTRIAYALVLRTKLEDLPGLKSDLEVCFVKHGVTIVHQRMSVGYLRVVEEPFRQHDLEGNT